MSAFSSITGEVWIHHLYVTGMPDWLRIGMMVTTLFIPCLSA